MLAEEVSEALSRATWCNPSSVRPSDEGGVAYPRGGERDAIGGEGASA